METLAPISQSRPIATPGPIAAPGPMRVPSPISAPAPTVTPGRKRHIPADPRLGRYRGRALRPCRLGMFGIEHGGDGGKGVGDRSGLQHDHAFRRVGPLAFLSPPDRRPRGWPQKHRATRNCRRRMSDAGCPTPPGRPDRRTSARHRRQRGTAIPAFSQICARVNGPRFSKKRGSAMTCPCGPIFLERAAASR